MMDPYGVLGVSSNASDEEIAKAYKKLAKRYHPDLNPGNTAAAERMGQINRAYDEIKTLRQSGNRQNSQGAYRAAYTNTNTEDPFTAYYNNFYRRYNADNYARSNPYPRRAAPFRMVLAVVLTFLLFRLVAVLIGGTVPVQRFLYGDGASSEPSYYYYYGGNMYP